VFLPWVVTPCFTQRLEIPRCELFPNVRMLRKVKNVPESEVYMGIYVG